MPENNDSSNNLLHGKKVLIVDDNETSRRTIEGYVVGWEMSARVAKNGAEALDILQHTQRNGFDIALIDMKMSPMRGIDLVNAIGKTSISAPKLIMMTSVTNSEEFHEIANENIYAYLSKPIHQQELHNCVVKIFGSGQHSVERPSSLKNLNKVTTNQLKGRRILLVEDNAVNQMLALSILKIFGCETDVAENGKIAIEKWKTNLYDLILMDFQMPEMDGFTAATIIRQIENEIASSDVKTTPMKIIALTANAMEGDRQKCLAAGMDDYLTKPFTQEKLYAILLKWLPAEYSEEITKTELIDEPEEPMESSDLLNLNALNAVRALQGTQGLEWVHQIIQLYFDSASKLINEMRESYATNNSETLRRAVHTLKSSSASIGGQKLADLCKAVELEVQENGMTPQAARQAEIEELFEQTRKALKQEVGIKD